MPGIKSVEINGPKTALLNRIANAVEETARELGVDASELEADVGVNLVAHAVVNWVCSLRCATENLRVSVRRLEAN